MSRRGGAHGMWVGWCIFLEASHRPHAVAIFWGRRNCPKKSTIHVAYLGDERWYYFLTQEHIITTIILASRWSLNSKLLIGMDATPKCIVKWSWDRQHAETYHHCADCWWLIIIYHLGEGAACAIMGDTLVILWLHHTAEYGYGRGVRKK